MALRVPPSRRPQIFEEEFAAPLSRQPVYPEQGEERPSSLSRSRGPGLKKPGKSSVHLSLYRKIATLFVGLTVVLLAFVLYISFARATATIIPRSERVESTISLTVESSPAPGAASLPGYVLETVLDGSKTFSVTAGEGAKKAVGTSCGQMTIINTQGKAQPLVEKTRLLSKDGVLFRITKSISVPAGGKTEVLACADQPGSSGDIGPTSFTIPGLSAELQKKTYAQSSAATSGGEKTIAIVRAEDIEQAVASLNDELAKSAMEKLKPLLPDPESAKASFSTTNIVKKETDAKAGAEQSSFTVSMSVHVVGVFYDPMALGQAAGAALRGTIGADKELLAVDPASLEAKLASADPAVKRAMLEVKLSGSAIRRGGETVDKSKIAGLKKKDAEQYLRSLSWVSSATVTLKPSWARKVPRLQDHIDIVIKEPKSTNNK